MLKKIGGLVFLLVAVFGLIPTANASEKTSTGFYYPLNDYDFSSSGYWLGPGLGTAGPNGHIGVDMIAPYESSVFAISDGIVYDISENGWGDGNVAVLVQHYISDGRWFIAVYGHLAKNLGYVAKGTKVYAGKTIIGKLGHYFTEPHLHFGIGSLEKIPGPTYGYSSSDHHNEFINPIQFMKNHAPGKSSLTLYRTVTDRNAYGKNVSLFWAPHNVSCINAQRWCYNGRCSKDYTAAICYDVHSELRMINQLKYILPDWQDTFFGAGYLDDNNAQCEP